MTAKERLDQSYFGEILRSLDGERTRMRVENDSGEICDVEAIVHYSVEEPYLKVVDGGVLDGATLPFDKWSIVAFC
jgi:hypothetical protein